jgi:hypothetical protein
MLLLKKLRGFSPQANYTDRATAAYQMLLKYLNRRTIHCTAFQGEISFQRLAYYKHVNFASSP